MTWVGWRLGRTESLIVLGILALVAALLVPTGVQMADAYHRYGLGGCLVHQGPSCGNAIGLFRSRFQSISDLAGWFNLVPGLVGVLLAAPFILDLEHGTYRLAWTQSITRGRWLGGKIGFAVGAALLAGGALTLLFNWWRGPVAHLDGRLETSTFDTTGIVFLAYTLFALGLALALGAVWRRSAASLTVAFVAYFVARIAVDYKLRDHLVSPLHATWRGIEHQPQSLNNAHVISFTGTVHGHQVFSGSGFFGGSTKFAAPGQNSAVFHAVYQPLSHYWPLQLTEAALFAGVALLLIGVAAWWTRERVG